MDKQYFYIKTPSILDIREIFTLGLTSKKGDESKIGHKGSGLKFTLAYLHRLGSNLSIDLPGEHYQSAIVMDNIRGREHSFITLNNGSVINTHITTSAGDDTWSQPWFILREMVQNAVDEQGEYGVSDTIPAYSGQGTLMTFPLVDTLILAWQDKDSWLHARNSNVIYESNSKALFYHGFAVTSPMANWQYSYDITECIARENISEDRQLRDMSMEKLFQEIVRKCPKLPDSFYFKMCQMAETGLKGDMDYLVSALWRAESGGNFPKCYSPEKLVDAIRQQWGDKVCLVSTKDKASAEHYFVTASGYYPLFIESYELKPFFSTSTAITSLVDACPTISGRMIHLEEVPLDIATKLKKAILATTKLRPANIRIKVVRPKHAKEQLAVAVACLETNEILIQESHIKQASAMQLIDTLVEEYSHISSQACDGSIAFEKFLIHQISLLLTDKMGKDTTNEF